MRTFVCFFLLSSMLIADVVCHGYLKHPPNRASRWKYGFEGPREYTDNQLSCGGRNTQWSKHGGKCGVCGDEYGISSPRFVYPGAFAINPPIVETYTEAELIEVTVKITAHHKGYFIFRVAPLVDQPITQAALNHYMLEQENGDQEWTLPNNGAGDYKVTLKLPAGLSCDHCVLQWWYTTGNNWNGIEPETFVNCADIKILPENESNPQTTGSTAPTAGPSSATCPPCNCPKPVVCPTVTPCSNQPVPPATNQPAPPATNQPPAPATTSSPSSGCYAISPAATNSWCTINCAAGFCPASHCQCT